jgi:hypothetical protein
MCAIPEQGVTGDDRVVRERVRQDKLGQLLMH